MASNEKKQVDMLLKRIYVRLREIINLQHDTHIEATVATIKKDIEFKGANVWILFFAVIVASVGLNVNSTAVIIGAMLISPLMGPINGIGLAIGIDDNELLRSALRNFFIMVGISILASTTYFLISPLSDAQSELLARTKPTVFDVLIAFFGGMAGIVAASRRENKITVISGVAIATALMPPLCTAGYGLGTGQLNYFFGAFYLFFINSFFIALATFLMVRYLHFPVKEYVDMVKRKAQRRTITIFSVIVIVPSIFFAWNMVNETRFNSQVIKYLQDVQASEVMSGNEIINSNRIYTKNERAVTISIIGNQLEEDQIEFLEKKLLSYGLTNTKLIVRQTSGSIGLGAQAGVLSGLLDKKDEAIRQKDSLINKLNERIQNRDLQRVDQNQLAQELVIQYPEIGHFSVAKSVYTNTRTLQSDTLTTVMVEYVAEINPEKVKTLQEWLKVRLNSNHIRIVEAPK